MKPYRISGTVELPVDEYPVKENHNSDGSITYTCGAWILLRKFADGRVLTITHDAPAAMMWLARSKAGLL